MPTAVDMPTVDMGHLKRPCVYMDSNPLLMMMRTGDSILQGLAPGLVIQHQVASPRTYTKSNTKWNKIVITLLI